MDLDTLDEAINRLLGGSAICFTGAGFSSEALDPLGTRLPTTRGLEEELCDLIEIPRDEGGSITDLADYCHSRPALEPKLRLHLVKRLTSSKPSAEQLKFFQAPWRAVFTTNFDDVAEQCLVAKQQVIRPSSKINSIVSGKIPIYYLHGRARDLVETDIEPLLVLSEKNYLELSVRNKTLHSALENELHCAGQIFFVGYSIRDIEVASRVFQLSESLRSKTIVICHPSDGKIAQARLEKFGAVFPIGLSGLVERFPKSFALQSDEQRLNSLSFVTRVPRQPAMDQLSNEHVDELIVTGAFSYPAYATQIRQVAGTQLYCVPREAKIDELFSRIDQGANKFVISSDIGNGKSVFLDQVTYEAHSRCYEVFRINNRLAEGLSELEYLLKRSALQLFIVDDLVRHRHSIEFVARRLPKLSVLVCSDRNVVDGDYEERLLELFQGNYGQIDLDTLSASELQEWDRFLEGWGLWGDRI